MVHPKEAMTLKKRMIEVSVTKPTKKKSQSADE
jgi:hypothetical protein